MNKRMFTILMCLFCLCAVKTFADDVVVVDRVGNNSIVSGQVTRISGESIFVENMGQEIEVELDNLDLDHLHDLFPPGMNIAARGHFKDQGRTIPKFRAEQIVRADNISALNSQTLLPNSHEHPHFITHHD